MTHTLRTARPEDEPALHALWATCFPSGGHLPALHALDPDRDRRTFVARARQRRTGPGAGPGTGTGAATGVDAAVVVVPRLLRGPDGAPERVGGIGSVATHPSARGLGLVRALLAEAVHAMEAAGYAWSLLFTGTPGVYEGSGWRSFPRPYAEGALADSAEGPAAPVPGVRVAKDGDDLPALHAAAHATRPLTAVRTAEDWRVRVPSWYGPGAHWLVADDPATGTAAGYAVATHHRATRTLEVREYGVRPGADPACLARLFAAHATAASAAGLTHARIPLTPEADPALGHLLPHPVLRTELSGMARALGAHADAAALSAPSAPGATHWHGDSF